MNAQAIAFSQVFAFVWRHWQRFPARFALIAGGVLLTIVIEIQVPARSAELVTSLQRYSSASS